MVHSVVQSPNNKTRRIELLAVTLVLLLAAATRILNIDGPALWIDEGFTYYTFRVDLFDALLGDRHPPFYFYTLHGWVELAGDSILAMRWWSFLPSMLSIAVAYQLGRELVRYRPGVPGAVGALSIPVLAALMMALADEENYLAQELRMYTWHVLMVAWSTLAYLRYVRQPDRRRGAWWGLANVASIYTHYLGGFALLVQGVHALIFLRGGARLGAIATLFVSGVLFLPWFFGVTLRQFSEDVVCVTCVAPSNWENLLDFRVKWLGEQWPLMLALLLLGMVALRYRRRVVVRWRPVLSTTLLLLGMLIAPVVLTYTLGYRDEPVFIARRFTQLTVPVTLLIALGMGNLQRNARAVIVGAVILYGVATVDWYRIKVPWDTLTRMVATYAEPGELMLAEVGFEESALRYYLDHDLPEGMQISTYPVWSGDDRFTYYERTLPALLAEQRSLQTDAVKTAWVIFFSTDNGLLNKLDEAGYIRTMTLTYDHVGSPIDVYRYDLMPEATVATFDSGMTLRAAEIRPNERRVDLWWSLAPSVESLDGEFVVSAFLLDENGVLVAQRDSPPANGQRPTRGWQPGEVIYDPHALVLAEGRETLLPGDYTVGVRVYRFAADGSIEPSPPADAQDGETYIRLDTVTYPVSER